MLPRSYDSLRCFACSSSSSSLFWMIILSIFLFSISTLLRFSYLFSSLSYFATAMYYDRSTVFDDSPLGFKMFSSRLRGFYLWDAYLQVNRYFGLKNPTIEILDTFLLLLVVLSIVMQISQLISEQYLWFVHSKNASSMCFWLLIELSIFPIVFIPSFGTWILFCV